MAKPGPKAKSSDAKLAKTFHKIGVNAFAQADHQFERYSALVHPSMNSVEELQNPVLYQLVAARIRPGMEIRLMATDYTWVAYGICCYKQGNDVGVKIMDMFDLTTDFDQSAVDDTLRDKFKVVNRGSTGWVIVNEDGSDFKAGLKSESDAIKKLSEHIRALKM